jgi:hypothetical protein
MQGGVPSRSGRMQTVNQTNTSIHEMGSKCWNGSKQAGPVQERVGSTEPVQQELHKTSPKKASSS